MNAAPSSYTSLFEETKQLAKSPAAMTLKEAQKHEIANTALTHIPQNVQRSPKSPSIPIQARRSLLSQRQLLEKAAAVVEFQDLRFYNRVVSGIKTTTGKQYESKELLEQNTVCLENIIRTRSDDVIIDDCNFGETSDNNVLTAHDWESDDEDQFVLDL